MMRRRLPTFLRIVGALGRGGLRLVRVWPWYAGILAVLLLAHTIFNIVASRELARELAAAKARGVPLTLAELAPPEVPDQENAALVYHRALTLVAGLKDPMFGPVLRFANPRVVTNAPEATESDVAQFITRHHEIFDMLQEGEELPRARYPGDWRSYPEPLFHRRDSAMGDAAWLLAADATVKARRGDASGAIADVKVALAMAESVAPEPAMWSQLLRSASGWITLKTLNTVMDTSPPSADDCYATYRVLSPVAYPEGYRRGLEAMRAQSLRFFDDVRRYPRGYWRCRGEKSPKWLFWPGLARFIWAPWLKKDEVAYLRHIDAVAPLYTKPYDEKARAARLRVLPRYAVVTRLLARGYGTAIPNRRDSMVALNRLAQWALAARVYQAKRGHYPAALSDVSRVVGWSLPKDPFTGRDFVYRREGRGYTLYSLGPNKRDDGGKERSPSTPTVDDIIWRMTR
jgi:hypothetical protein